MIEKLQDILREAFDNDTIKLSLDTSSDDIEEWDSFNHVKFILLCEENFNIKFDVQEVAELNNIKSLIETIKNKTT